MFWEYGVVRAIDDRPYGEMLGCITDCRAPAALAMTGVCHLERSEAESKDPRSVAMFGGFFVVLLLRMTEIGGLCGKQKAQLLLLYFKSCPLVAAYPPKGIGRTFDSSDHKM